MAHSIMPSSGSLVVKFCIHMPGAQDVLIPRTDTEVLAEQAIAYIQTLGESRVLDLCSRASRVEASTPLSRSRWRTSKYRSL